MKLCHTAAVFAAVFAVNLFAAPPAAASESGAANPSLPGFRADESDPRAVALADRVMEALGGRAAWDDTRHVSWVFFGGRRHFWDRATGDVRIESDGDLVLMNIHTKKGRVWQGGEEVTDPDSLAAMLDAGFAWWTNDSYWVFMPYKLKDTGVTLGYGGQRKGVDGRPCEVIEMTFAGVGLTPDNRYEVLVDDGSGLVTEWSFFADAADDEPRFTMPWADWKRLGGIMLAGSHGREKDWKLAVYDDLPRSVYESPEPVTLP